MTGEITELIRGAADERGPGAGHELAGHGVPGSAVIERNVLEWRLDPTSPHRHPGATGHDRTIVVLCQEGYASSLAVAALRLLGLRDVHDLAGGFAAWAAAGLPVGPATDA